MASKFYIFDTPQEAQEVLDLLTQAWGEGVPYTEIRVSNNGKGYAVQDGDWSLQYTNLTPVELPADFYIEEE